MGTEFWENRFGTEKESPGCEDEKHSYQQNTETVQAGVMRSPCVEFVIKQHLYRSIVQVFIAYFHRIYITFHTCAELQPSDHLMWRQFCEQMLKKINNNDEFVNNLWMSDDNISITLVILKD